VEQIVSHKLIDLEQVEDNTRVKLAGVIAGSRKTVTKRGEVMAYFSMEDLSSSMEVLVFPRTFMKFGSMVIDDRLVFVEGRLSKNEEEIKIFAESISFLEDALPKGQNSPSDKTVEKEEERRENNEQRGLKPGVYIKIATVSSDYEFQVKDVLGKYPGKVPVYLYFDQEKRVIQVNSDLWVEPSQDLEQAVCAVWGPGSYKRSANN
ncbi:MAG TPA: OB-fold nucleic acid binding domain-containing protein, partial [Verrucomicrobiae bacterium]|nr:OB-fold nucleic acid binding domain-containing protein [Verrucomicrobiae bacterium]